MIADYEKKVYTAVLGKVIGVYLGRPFEGWTRAKIAEKWGEVVRYVNDDCKVPLVVPDDDISGTFTFIKVLADSGLYADTPDAFFGETWLNYLWENRTVLWWGGLGNSTEHTAYLRLARGVTSPRSGSMELNSRTVAEQIGAQIFIDAFGMVAPGDCRLAARLAERAARVSHDGEAVYAAMAVAAMVSAAFELDDIDAILDRAVSVIPPSCLIARIHREVRSWAAAESDWRRVYDRIAAEYGYDRYGGNCHVIPNHAVMVMAWACGRGDFFRTMSIAASAGWDTDCNAGNVGTVAALVAGLDRLSDGFDFRAPFADRMLIPTACGDDSVTDAALTALRVAAVGRRVMGMPSEPPPKGGAWLHFAFPGAVHGFMPEDGGSSAVNPDGRGLRFRGRISAPLLGMQYAGMPYPAVSTPQFYPGMTLSAAGRGEGDGVCRMFVRQLGADGRPAEPPLYSPPQTLRSGDGFVIRWRPPLTRAAAEIGFESDAPVLLDRVERSGSVAMRWVSAPVLRPTGVGAGFLDRDLDGWITNADMLRGAFTDDPSPDILYLQKNSGAAVLVTGDRHFSDTAFECRLRIHLADRAGVLLDYRGMRRFLAVVFSPGRAFVVRAHGGETVLAEAGFDFGFDRTRRVAVKLAGGVLHCAVDGAGLFDVRIGSGAGSGGAGIIVENGMAGFHDLRLDAGWNESAC